MACGCGRSKGALAKSRLFSAPRPGLAAAGQVTNFTPIAALSLPPPAQANDADKRRIQKLRQEAIQRSLGRLA